MVSVVGGGGLWGFVVMHLEKAGIDLEVRAKITPFIDIVSNPEKIYKLLVRAARAAIWCPLRKLNEPLLPNLRIGNLNFVPSRCTGYRRDKSVTILWTLEESEIPRVVLKFAPKVELQDQIKEEKTRHVRTRTCLENCEDCVERFKDHFAEMVDFPCIANLPLVCTMYCGNSLDVCLNHFAGIDDRERLARKVCEQVGSAICALHRVAMVFVDLHPGNIVIENNQELNFR